jgi:hypothetical protein
VSDQAISESIPLGLHDQSNDHEDVNPVRPHVKTRIREACANPDQEILHNVWQEVEYRFDVAQPLVALTLKILMTNYCS